MTTLMNMKDWFKKVLRMNKDKKITARACTDTLLMDLLNCKKGSLPSYNNMLNRLRAIRHPLDEELPARASTAPQLKAVELQKPVAPGNNLPEEESSSPKADATSNPLILQIYQMMSGMNSRFEKLESNMAYVMKKVDSEEVGASSPQCPSSLVEVDEEETDRSPIRQSDRVL